MALPETHSTCPTCWAEVAASQVRTNGLLAQATCSACGSSWTFDVSDFARQGVGARDRPPPGIEVRETVAGLTLRRRWLSPTSVFLTVTSLFSIPLFIGPFVTSRAGLFVVAVLVVGLATMAFAGYMGLTGFVNRTTIQVDRRQLRVEHGPLPAFWVKKAPPLEIAEVRQLFVRSAPRRPMQPSSRMEHWLYAALRDGSEVMLVGRLEQLAQARFLERTIEAYLGIAPDNAHF